MPDLLLRTDTALIGMGVPSSSDVHCWGCRWREMQKHMASPRTPSHQLGVTSWMVGWGTTLLSSMPHQLSLKMQLIRNSFLVVQARAVRPLGQAMLQGSL